MDDQEAADFYRLVLSDALHDLMEKAGGSRKIDEVKMALKNISKMYNEGLSIASSKWRPNWSDPVHRFAYVFMYLMQHCHLVSFSLERCISTNLNSWKDKSNLKVCSIGGGPGSDLVGLTTFLRKKGIFPPSLECLVLDLYPDWKDTWNTIYQCVPEYFGVAYERCDIVRDADLTTPTRRFIHQADMLTLVKFFSAVSAFFRENPRRGDLLRSILQEIKPGCFVLYIDNEYGVGIQFEKNFASPVGLRKVAEFRHKATLPRKKYSGTVMKYCRELKFLPLSECNVLIQVYKKLAEVQPASRPGTISQVQPTEHVRDQSTDSNSASLAGNSETSTGTQDLSTGLRNLSLVDDESTPSESSHLRRTSSVEPDEKEGLSTKTSRTTSSHRLERPEPKVAFKTSRLESSIPQRRSYRSANLPRQSTSQDDQKSSPNLDTTRCSPEYSSDTSSD